MDTFKLKYLKYKSKYLALKKQSGGNLNFRNFPCTIFHAFDIKFIDIIKMIPELKANGITHIQPSPIQKCRMSIGPALMKKKNLKEEKIEWWLAYQPISYQIGNIYGTEREFNNLVSVCKLNGIELVIDIVINHLQASKKFEYAIWNLILLLSEIPYDDEKITMFEIYKILNNPNFNIETYISKNESKKEYIHNIIINILKEQYIVDYTMNTKTYQIIDKYIKDAFEELKIILSDYLDITPDKFKIEYYKMIRPPFWCSDDVAYGYNCWLAQALPQLNQNHPKVQEKIKNYLYTLHTYGIKCLRIDAASHIKPEILKLYKEYFDFLTKGTGYVYSEVINPQGKLNKLNLLNFSTITHLTEYNLLITLTHIFCFQCSLEPLKILQLPSRDIGSVVFSVTHDLITINDNDSSLTFGEYSKIPKSESYKLILMICYLLQRIYNVPLVFKTQFEDQRVKDCCKLRKFLYNNNCERENSEIIDGIIFKSIKYNNRNDILATFYLNVSDSEKIIDGNKITGRNILIIY